MLTRRRVLAAGGGLGVLAATGLLRGTVMAQSLPAGTVESAVMDALPGKRPLIKRSFRPPNYETPVELFQHAYTPNDAFFVRWHLADIPQVDAAQWRLRIGGPAAGRPTEFTLDDLKRGFEAIELAAICQCSGNRRGFSQPPVTGVEWGYGAMGNARWRGVRLKEVLDKVGVRKEAVEIAFDGADKGVVEKTPDFVKSLPVWKALDENTLIAFEMNGEPLPHWNGFPARLVVPGWTATYWVKQLTDIEIRTEPFTGFWMAKGYRIPRAKFPLVERFASQEGPENTAITEMVVNSMILSPTSGLSVRRGLPMTVRGIAWDGGYGIRAVDVSMDGGRTWHQAQLGKDLGRFAWRQWQFDLKPAKAGQMEILARAANSLGQTQTADAIWNPAGYHHNVMPRVSVSVV